MGMRITNSMLTRTALNGVFEQRQRLAVTQEQAATGLRINRPSDDPVGASRAAILRSEAGANSQFQRNIEQALGRMVTVERSIASSQDAILRARELAIQGANDSLGPEARSLLAKEVETLFDELLAAGNARHAGGAVFAGTVSATLPFVRSGPFVSGSPPPTVTFAGDTTEIEVGIAEGRRIPTTLSGARVFQGDGNGDGLPDGGRDDAFAVLGELYRALDTDDRAAIAGSLDRLDRVQLQFELELARVGAVGSQIERVRERLESERVDLESRLSETQDASIERIFTDLSLRETALEASLQAAARSIAPSLMDFLG